MNAAIRYIIGAKKGTSENTAPAKTMITGSFAPHGIMVAVISVSLLSLSEPRVLAVIRAGTPQPEPIRYGMKALPLIPIRLKIRSRINEALVM